MRDHRRVLLDNGQGPGVLGVGRKAFLVALVALLAGIASPFGGSRPDAEFAAIAASTREAPLTHEWQLVEGKYWQIVSSHSEDLAATDAAEGTRGDCPPGMVKVQGLMKTDRPGREPIEDLQKDACTEWISHEFPERCARYGRGQWLWLSRDLPVEPVRFCIDRFEYPNRGGAYPLIVVSYLQAKELCAREEKRLCTEAEWTFACEGEEAMPYPYGYERDSEACVADRPWREVDLGAFAFPQGWRALAEIDRLWQGEQSGVRGRCRSPSGVYDLTGNVDEWTTSIHPGERPSILKGGYWGPVRSSCRPSTRVHGETFVFYQIGFRCCADAPPPPPPGEDAGPALRTL